MFRALAIFIIALLAADYFMFGGQYTESFGRFLQSDLNGLLYDLARMIGWH
jgi:hypothetical protein